MCKGAAEEIGICTYLRADNSSDDACVVMPKKSCELCDSQATVYCQADDAYLCKKCDNWVHGANFLAQRHVRCLLCTSCQKLTQRYRVGVSSDIVLPSLIPSPERVQCDDDPENDRTESRKMPFLFL